MSKVSIIVGSILGFILLISLWFSGNYNSLVTSKSQVDNSWAAVEVQYQRRLDLIDNLVSSAKGAQKQEVEVFGKIADARSRYNSAVSTDDKTNAANDIETNIALLPRLQEAYPDLKSNEQIKALMNELSSTEGAIANVRDSYNKTATNYNIGVQRFPKSIFAKVFNYGKVPMFKASSGADKATKVEF
jgi:LemA protein